MNMRSDENAGFAQNDRAPHLSAVDCKSMLYKVLCALQAVDLKNDPKSAAAGWPPEVRALPVVESS